MFKLPPAWSKKFSLGISLKLFLAFWLVILTSVLISYLVTMQFRHSPIQEQANPQQLKLLKQYTQKLADKDQVRLKKVQENFRRKYHQYLLIKKISNNKVYTPRKRGWSEVRDYLTKHPLENPVTVDFAFTKVTSSEPIIINGEQFQLFIANEVHRKRLVSLVNQLPVALRLLMLLTISFLSCWLLAKSFTNPLIAIQKASESIGEGKLATRITKFDQRSDEFGTLARSFNKMAEQLENNITAHQRLLGDVSHELRSPLTRLQLAVALAEKNMGNDVEQQKHLNRCETEVERLDEMIADVLTLSRLEHNQNVFAADDIDLSTLVAQVVNDCQYFATSRNVTIVLKTQANCALLADSKLLSSAISNVVNNAVKYSPNDQVVTVELRQINEQIMLIVSDQGPGVPNEMIEKLFTPFFRVADGRERSSGGTGLGLAIAQQAILFHQGDIVAQNQESSGLKVIITLPTLSKQNKSNT
ncbi:ATP-binding protein [Colwellia psychrerythraea]|uniref:histidine kinase n=1 Tax=Colwellia psychrerythraea (strain 34H / ATCC BAA-681) TaxID=167879 RepID=Q484N5_COLP3|nr:ATP-binding protein [Colwellia psychrerythraea]AAZ27013.1 sensor protein CpxA [Colwellia psychrerythraea 34H]